MWLRMEGSIKKDGGAHAPPTIITTNICYFLYKYFYNIFLIIF